MNIELPDPDCSLHLVQLVREGVLKEKQLDELVAPMLHWKFQVGLFDDPYVDPDEADPVVGCNAHRPLLGGYSGLPKHNVTVGVLFAICTILLLAYPLDKRSTIEMAEELAERRRKAPHQEA